MDFKTIKHHETTMNKIYSYKSTIIIFMGVTSNTFKN
jgi:hypothetical protein